MTSVWPEDFYNESDAYDDGEGAFDDSEDNDGEASLAERRRRERLQRMRVARQSQQARDRTAAVRRPSGPVRPTPEQAVTAIRNLDVDNKIQDDRFRRALTGLRKDQLRANYVLAASGVVTAVIDTFQVPKSATLQTVLKAAPQLALVKAPRPGAGFVGYLGSNPVVPGLAAVAAITILGSRRERTAEVNRLQIDGPAQLSVSDTDVFVADVFDAKGKRLTEAVTWRTSDDRVASFAPGTNQVTAHAVGHVRVFAKAGDVEQSVRLEVPAGPVQATAGPAPKSGTHG